MNRITLFVFILFFVDELAIAQDNKFVAQGKPYTTDVVMKGVKKDGKEADPVNFNYGVNELKTKSYESALKTYNKYLVSNPEDYNARYNRGLAYYFLDDISHACMDWKYAAYFNVYDAKKNFTSVCDPSITSEFLNGGMVVQPVMYDKNFEANAIENPPSFPGGQEELNKFLRENLMIPKSLKVEFLNSRIIVRLKIKEDGSLSNPEVMESENSDLTNEAIRVASKMPKWVPATRKGKPVESEYYYPVINGRDSIRKANKLFIEGVRLFDQTDYKGAVEIYSSIIAVNDADDDAHFNRGVCYVKLGDTAKACEDWNIPILSCQISVMDLLNKYCGANISRDKLPGIRDAGQKIYTIVEEMPSFPGGEEAMLNYVSESVVYPKDARKKKISGRIYVSFIVDKDGYVREPRILRGIGEGCDEEALRVVRMMPNWNPGYQSGRPVNVQYNLPMNFTLK